MGVFVGHSETILRPEATDDDDQPLWWALAGCRQLPICQSDTPSRVLFTTPTNVGAAD